MAGGSIDASIAGDRGWMRQTALEKLFREDDELFREEEKLFREEEKRWHQQEERCWEMEPSSLR
jgi:predicted phosphohydrolase